MKLKDLEINTVFTFKDQWFRQFIFQKTSENTIKNLDTSTSSKINNYNVEVDLIIGDYIIGDLNRIKNYINLKEKISK